VAANLRETHGLYDEPGDVASASFLETWIDKVERHTWFLFEASRPSEFDDGRFRLAAAGIGRTGP